MVGSINLDIVASASRLPRPGETVGGAALARHPGGKGANQALAARRLGVEVEMIGAVGSDPFAGEALALLRDGGVDLGHVQTVGSAPTGVALIVVSEDGENQIVVAPGANHRLDPDQLPPLDGDALILQCEIPLDVVARAASLASGLVVLNAAPAMSVPSEVLTEVDVVVVNEIEYESLSPALGVFEGLVVRTLGARGAAAVRDGEVVASAPAPRVAVVDTVGAGDAFVAALTVALLEDQEPATALAFACAAGSLATTRSGAQPSLPQRAEVDAMVTR